MGDLGEQPASGEVGVEVPISGLTRSQGCLCAPLPVLETWCCWQLWEVLEQ
jgi:hypothetical protein